MSWPQKRPHIHLKKRCIESLYIVPRAVSDQELRDGLAELALAAQVFRNRNCLVRKRYRK
jgi:hypothetical protein